jgi:hypothetical protein
VPVFNLSVVPVGLLESMLPILSQRHFLTLTGRGEVLLGFFFFFFFLPFHFTPLFYIDDKNFDFKLCPKKKKIKKKKKEVKMMTTTSALITIILFLSLKFIKDVSNGTQPMHNFLELYRISLFFSFTISLIFLFFIIICNFPGTALSILLKQGCVLFWSLSSIHLL